MCADEGRVRRPPVRPCNTGITYCTQDPADPTVQLTDAEIWQAAGKSIVVVGGSGSGVGIIYAFPYTYIRTHFYPHPLSHTHTHTPPKKIHRHQVSRDVCVGRGHLLLPDRGTHTSGAANSMECLSICHDKIFFIHTYLPLSLRMYIFQEYVFTLSLNLS